MFSFDGFRLAAWPKQHQNLCDGGYAYSLHHQWHAARYPRPRHDLKGCCRQTLLPISGRPRLGWQRVLGCSLRERLSEFSSFLRSLLLLRQEQVGLLTGRQMKPQPVQREAG